jgi:IS30 family transposase
VKKIEKRRIYMPKGYRHLTLSQRCQISELISRGFIQKDIAEKIGVSKSTLSRELSRNTGDEGYQVWQASYRAALRRHQASSKPKKMTAEVIFDVERCLQKQWSPEQISGRLKREGKKTVSHERIYQYIWKNKWSGGILYPSLAIFTTKIAKTI